jgi:hypothetical protein
MGKDRAKNTEPAYLLLFFFFFFFFLEILENAHHSPFCSSSTLEGRT